MSEAATVSSDISSSASTNSLGGFALREDVAEVSAAPIAVVARKHSYTTMLPTIASDISDTVSYDKYAPNTFL